MAAISDWRQSRKALETGCWQEALLYASRERLHYILEAQVVAMLTQTEVDPADPAFSHPAKFIGPCYSKEEAEKCARRRLRLIDNLLRHDADDHSHKGHKGSLSQSRIAFCVSCHVMATVKFCWHNRIRYALTAACMM